MLKILFKRHFRKFLDILKTTFKSIFEHFVKCPFESLGKLLMCFEKEEDYFQKRHFEN